MHQQMLFHHDRRHKFSDSRRPFGVFTACHIRCLLHNNNRITTMLMLIPLLCSIIYLSVSYSQHSIDAEIRWQSQLLLLHETTAQLLVSSSEAASTSTTTQQSTGIDESRLRLRYNYTKLQRYSSLAKDIALIQSNKDCTTTSTKGYFWYRNRYGLGSDLHVYSVAICNALQMNYDSNTTTSIHVQSLLPWIWYDSQNCGQYRNDPHSAMSCYFPESEPTCPTKYPLEQDHDRPTFLNLTRPHGKIKEACPDVIQMNGGIRSIRSATTEFLFTRVSTFVQEEGERQLNQVFRTTSVPHNLITIHIRWGDKADEMKLIPITKYIDAVYEILEQRRRNRVDSSDGVHIFLATEDPEALRQFQAAAPNDWNIYIDQYHTELLPHRKESTVYNGIPQMAKELSGRPGLIALGSLLVAMEANDYILTTSSNWSRLMNEIRISIVNPRCNKCTTMIDLNPGEW